MFIYKTTNKINGKIYIGKLVRESKVYLGSGKILKLSLEKYGRDNFTREIIEYCDCKTQLIEREKFWIKHYNSTDRNIGYNLTKGGDGGSTNNFFLNKKLTPEHKLKISQNPIHQAGGTVIISIVALYPRLEPFSLLMRVLKTPLDAAS
jgi:group I intron endonuclease